ncbi:hypothetical protein BCR44DRAFT_1483041 [Catenaria anguillulae PL171]|uniref:Uncharacterized protein n=1 Tax=Catenaria anguillulae PL171 TaxID=765915 RepID=A0A1Y2HXG7_9FUNG|nr:hypothetical protein BCR44DRAFT_1483041 [Catenaria anguillulae PL171]
MSTPTESFALLVKGNTNQPARGSLLHCQQVLTHPSLTFAHSRRPPMDPMLANKCPAQWPRHRPPKAALTNASKPNARSPFPSQLTDCSLKHCISEYWAAYGSLCISLDAPIFRTNGITLPRLPPNADPSLGQLHRDYLASNPSSTKLGICAPIPPLGVPCGLGIPNLEPMPKTAILSPQLPQGSPWPRVVDGVQPLNPVRLLFALPPELKSDYWNTA